MPRNTNKKSRGISFRPDRKGERSSGRSWFFGIGINEYFHFPKLHNASKDINDINSLLNERYVLDESIFLLDKQATRHAIIDQLYDLQNHLKENDKLIIFYSGHGHLDKKDRGYWLPVDAIPQKTSSFIRSSTIRELVEDIECRHILLISDSCFSGTLLPRNADYVQLALEEMEREPSRWVISSGRQREQVSDGRPGKNSPFTASILKVLRINQQASLNANLLFDKVTKLTTFKYKQLPQSAPLYNAGHEGGQYVFHLNLEAIEERDWQAYQKTGTQEAFQTFLERYPNGQYAVAAKNALRKLEETAWEKAKTENSISSYHKYSQSFPTGKYHTDALNAIERLEDEKAWQIAKTKDIVDAYQIYLKQYPEGSHVLQAKKAIQELSQPLSKIEKGEQDRQQRRNRVEGRQFRWNPEKRTEDKKTSSSKNWFHRQWSALQDNNLVKEFKEEFVSQLGKMLVGVVVAFILVVLGFPRLSAWYENYKERQVNPSRKVYVEVEVVEAYSLIPLEGVYVQVSGDKNATGYTGTDGRLTLVYEAEARENTAILSFTKENYVGETEYEVALPVMPGDSTLLRTFQLSSKDKTKRKVPDSVFQAFSKNIIQRIVPEVFNNGTLILEGQVNYLEGSPIGLDIYVTQEHGFPPSFRGLHRVRTVGEGRFVTEYHAEVNLPIHFYIVKEGLTPVRHTLYPKADNGVIQRFNQPILYTVLHEKLGTEHHFGAIGYPKLPIFMQKCGQNPTSFVPVNEILFVANLSLIECEGNAYPNLEGDIHTRRQTFSNIYFSNVENKTSTSLPSNSIDKR